MSQKMEKPFNLQENRLRFLAKVYKYEAARDQTSRRIEQLEQSLTKARKAHEATHKLCPDWVKEVVQPIRDAMAERFPNLKFSEVYGPFGMNAEVSFYAKEGEHTLAGLHFRPGNLFGDKPYGERQLHLVDYTVDTHQFAPGTIAEVNGYNHPSVPMPATFEELVALFAKSIEAGRREIQEIEAKKGPA